MRRRRHDEGHARNHQATSAPASPEPAATGADVVLAGPGRYHAGLRRGLCDWRTQRVFEGAGGHGNNCEIKLAATTAPRFTNPHANDSSPHLRTLRDAAPVDRRKEPPPSRNGSAYCR